MKKIILLILLLAGCATHAPQYLNQSVSADSEGRYPVSVERGKHFGLDTTALYVFIDDEPVATIDGGKTATIYVSPGHHVVGVNFNKSQPDATVAVNVSQSNQPILRTNVAAWGWAGVKLEHVNE